MNIEKTISEHAVSDILTPMLESQDRIVTEDVAPLFDQATGLDTPTASGTVTTTIEESRNLISAIIRTAWTAPLTMLGGASVISSIAAAYTYLRNRLQGSETYGIPDRRSEISASSPLAANLALLNDRKISGADVPDGMSMARILCDSAVAATITEITDDTTRWTMTKAFPWSMFPNIKNVEFGCESTTIYPIDVQGVEILSLPCLKVYDTYTNNGIKAKQVSLPALEMVGLTDGSGHSNSFLPNLEMEELTLPKLWKVDCTKESDYSRAGFIRNNNIKRLYLPALTWIREGRMQGTISDCAELEVLSMPKLTNLQLGYGGSNYFLENCPKLTHLEIGEGYNNNLNLAMWNPTNVLADQDLLQQFLENFRSVLFTRLAQRTSTTSLTLTLSPAVYKAVYGLDADYNVDPNALAQTASLGDLGIATEDLNEIEIAAGITTATKYATWLDTYRGAIYWNIGHA